MCVSLFILSKIIEPNVSFLGLVVEDAINGILSGKAAGARTLGVATSSSKEVVAAGKPDWIVEDLTQ